MCFVRKTELAINSTAVLMYFDASDMQPSSVFTILNEITNTGKCKIVDNTLFFSAARDAESVVRCVSSVAPPSALNRDTTDAKDLIVKTLKNQVSEHDSVAAIGAAADDTLSVDKENVEVECMKSADGSVTCSASLSESRLFKYNSVNDGHSERTDESLSDDTTCGRCDAAAAVKLCTVPNQQRKTFSLGAEDVSHSTMPLQSDSLDVMNLICEVAGMYQRSTELSGGNTNDILTQEIEAHEDQFDCLKQQSSTTGGIENLVAVAQKAVHATSSQSTCSNGIDAGEQQADTSQLSDSILEPASHTAAAAAGTRIGHLPLSVHHVPLQTLQCGDVHTECNEAGNSSSVLPSKTELSTVAVSSDNIQQRCVPTGTADVDMCSESPADNNVAHLDRSRADVAAANDNCVTKWSVSEEVLMSQVDDTTSDVDSESGERLAPSTFVYTLHL